MTVTPRRTTKNIWTDNATALDYEIAQEKASTLGRLGRALEAALAALREFDAQPHDPAEAKQTRGALVAEASRALWHFVVQREAGSMVASQTIALPARVANATQPCALRSPTRGLPAAVR